MERRDPHPTVLPYSYCGVCFNPIESAFVPSDRTGAKMQVFSSKSSSVALVLLVF